MILILAALLASPGWGAWSVCKKLTVNSGQVTGGPHSNFRWVISGTYSWLASTGNGGVITDAQGDDFRLYSTADCSTTAVSYHRVKWTDTGVVEIWVISTIDNGSEFYIGAGDSGVTTDGSSAATVWSGMHAVWLLPDGTTLSDSDSGPNAYTLTNTGVAAAAGKIDGGAAFDGGASTDKLSNASATTSYTTMSQCVWLNVSAVDSTARRIHNAGASPLLDQAFIYTTNGLEFQAGWDGTIGAWYATAPSTSTWHLFCVTYDGSATTNDPIFYVDGASVSITEAAAPSGNKNTGTTEFSIGNRPAGDRAFNGSLDSFIRIHGTIWTANEVATMYNNQSAPDTFYAITDQTVTSRPRRIVVQ